MKIIIRRTSTGYTATFKGDAGIMERFGTDTLPTPFTARATPEEVVRAIQEKNPTCEVCYENS